jgi:Aspartyl protease
MRLLAFVLVLLPGWAWAGCVVQPRATIGLRVIEGMWLVPVMVNGIEGTFILDTGAARSVVTREATQHLRLARDPWVSTTMRGVGGVERLPNAVPESLTLGGVPLMRRTLSHDTSLTVGTLPHAAGGVVVDGLLGRDFLSAFDLDVEWAGRRVVLMAVSGCAGRFVPWQGAYDAVPAENPVHSALVLPVVLDGVRLRALLDTGAGSTLIAAPGMSRLGLTVAGLEGDASQAVSGLGPRSVIMRRHAFGSLRVGADIVERPVYWVSAERLNPIVDMLLGADWFVGKRVWISFATKQVFVAGR